MFTIEKASKLLEVVYLEYPSLQDEEILIKLGNEFSAMIDTLGSVITIEKSLDRQSKFYKYIKDYLKTEFNLDSNKLMFYDYLECFSFLHEVGHVYYQDMQTESIVYNNFRNKVHSSYKDAFLEYRQIPGEKLADSFAATMLNNRLTEIWAIMQDTTIEKAKEEILFWSEV